MSLIRIQSDADAKTLTSDRPALDNPALSWRAKGIHTYLMRFPTGWQLTLEDLQHASPCGRDALYATLNELHRFGYITHERKRSREGDLWSADLLRPCDPCENQRPGNRPGRGARAPTR